MYETGARLPSDEKKIAIAKYYSMTVQSIFLTPSSQWVNMQRLQSSEVSIMDDKVNELQAKIDNVATVLRSYASENRRIFTKYKSGVCVSQ